MLFESSACCVPEEDWGFINESEIKLRLCNEVRAKANSGIQMMALSVRQVYMRNRSLLGGRPLLVTPRSLPLLASERSRDLLGLKDGNITLIGKPSSEDKDLKPLANLAPYTSAADLVPAVKQVHDVPMEVREACRVAEEVHRRDMVAVLGSRRAEIVEKEWSLSNLNHGFSCSCGVMTEVPSQMKCRIARMPSSALSPERKLIYDQIFKTLLSQES